MQRFSSLLASLVLACGACAQEATLYGQVEDVQNTANQWFLDCTNIQLQSAALQLAPFHRQYVKLRGTNVGTASAPRIEVSSIEAFPQVVNLGGDRRPGTRFELELLLAAGTPYAAYVAVGGGYLPLGEIGTWYLGVANMLVAAGTTRAALTTIHVPIPNDASLVGLEVLAQAAYLAGGTEPVLSNVDCKQIRD
jgi:hypothetical protein